jgi:hypothetical protein
LRHRVRHGPPTAPDLHLAGRGLTALLRLHPPGSP